MKPKKAPSSLEWHELPTFDHLKEQSGIKVAALRLRLAEVPCWRCEDNSVRYELEAAEAAIADTPGVLLEQQSANDSEATPTVLGLLNAQIQIGAQAAKQHAETIKAMQAPLMAGVEMCRLSSDRQEKRLSALEATFDRMLASIEQGATSQHERDLAVKKQEASAQLRQQTFGLVKTQLPAIVNKWSITSKATMALGLIESLDPKMVQAFLDGGILSDEQAEALRKLSRKPEAAAAAEAEHDNAAAEEPN
jgi:hypothetical protein